MNWGEIHDEAQLILLDSESVDIVDRAVIVMSEVTAADGAWMGEAPTMLARIKGGDDYQIDFTFGLTREGITLLLFSLAQIMPDLIKDEWVPPPPGYPT